jgi:hypothetical protein
MVFSMVGFVAVIIGFGWLFNAAAVVLPMQKQTASVSELLCK